MPELIRILTLLGRGILLIFVDKFISIEDSVNILFIIGLAPLTSLILGIERNYRSNKLNFREAHKHISGIQKSHIVIIKPVLIIYIFCYLLCIIFYNKRLDILLFIFLYTFMDLYFSEYIKIYLINGEIIKYSLTIFYRTNILWFPILIKYIINIDINIYIITNTILSIIIIYSLSKNRYIFSKTFLSIHAYLKSFKMQSKYLIFSGSNKMRLVLFRTFLLNSTSSDIVLILYKLISVFGFIEIFFDIFFISRKYKDLRLLKSISSVWVILKLYLLIYFNFTIAFTALLYLLNKYIYNIINTNEIHVQLLLTIFLCTFLGLESVLTALDAKFDRIKTLSKYMFLCSFVGFIICLFANVLTLIVFVLVNITLQITRITKYYNEREIKQEISI